MAVSVGDGQHLSLGALMEESLSVWLLLIRGVKRVSIAFYSAGVSGQFIQFPQPTVADTGTQVMR